MRRQNLSGAGARSQSHAHVRSDGRKSVFEETRGRADRWRVSFQPRWAGREGRRGGAGVRENKRKAPASADGRSRKAATAARPAPTGESHEPRVPIHRSRNLETLGRSSSATLPVLAAGWSEKQRRTPFFFFPRESQALLTSRVCFPSSPLLLVASQQSPANVTPVDPARVCSQPWSPEHTTSHPNHHIRQHPYRSGLVPFLTTPRHRRAHHHHQHPLPQPILTSASYSLRPPAHSPIFCSSRSCSACRAKKQAERQGQLASRQPPAGSASLS